MGLVGSVREVDPHWRQEGERTDVSFIDPGEMVGPRLCALDGPMLMPAFISADTLATESIEGPIVPMMDVCNPARRRSQGGELGPGRADQATY